MGKCCVVAIRIEIVSWEERKSTSDKKRTQFFWYPLSYLSVYLSNHVCSSCSSTLRAKIHWNVLVLSAVYRKLLNYKMVNKIYFKDLCAAVSLCRIMDDMMYVCKISYNIYKNKVINRPLIADLLGSSHLKVWLYIIFETWKTSCSTASVYWHTSVSMSEDLLLSHVCVT